MSDTSVPRGWLQSETQSIRVRLEQTDAERRRTEETLRESELRFRQMAESLGAVLWICSLDWKELYYISPAFEKLWGRPSEILYQNPLAWLDTLVEEDRAMALDLASPSSRHATDARLSSASASTWTRSTSSFSTSPCRG